MSYPKTSSRIKLSLVTFLPSLFFFLSCLTFIVFSNWNAAVRISLDKTFGDLRLITSNSECVLNGVTETLLKDCDPWGRDFNYPKAWLEIAKFFGIRSSATDILGISLVVILTISFSILALSFKYSERSSVFSLKGDTFLRTIIFCSPPSFLLAERGNIETIIFFLLILIAILPLKYFWTTVIIWVLAGNLKIYPIISFVFMSMHQSRFRRSLVSLIFGFSVFAYFTAGQLKGISKASDYFPFDSFGSQIFSRMLCYPQKTSGLLCNSNIQVLLGLITLLAAWMFIQVFLKNQFERIREKFHKVLQGSPKTDKAILVFGSTFLFTFLIGTNWDYRLVLIYPIALIALSSGAESREIKVVLLSLIAPLYLSYNEWAPLQILGDLILIPLFFFISSVVYSIMKSNLGITKVIN
jgi:hypothetical protein